MFGEFSKSYPYDVVNKGFALFVTVVLIWHLGGESKAPDKILTFVLLNLYFGASKQSQQINILIIQLTVKGQINGLSG